MKTIIALIARMLLLILCTVIIILMLIQTIQSPEYSVLNKIATAGLAIIVEILAIITCLIQSMPNDQNKK